MPAGEHDHSFHIIYANYIRSLTLNADRPAQIQHASVFINVYIHILIFVLLEWINELVSRLYLVVVSLAVRQALALVMPMPKKRFLTFSTHEMLQTRRRHVN